MPLSQKVLETELSRVFSSLLEPGGSSATFSHVTKLWAAAYHAYASHGMAEGGGIPKTSKALVVSHMKGKDFFSELSSGISLYWMSAVWAPSPGFVFVTLSSTGLLPLLRKVSVENMNPDTSVPIASKRIARALHTYTTEMVKVTSTNTSSGATLVVNVR